MTPYVSVDLETTGLDTDLHQVLEIGAVFENWKSPVDELPTLRVLVKHEQIVGDPYALAMNVELLKELAAGGGVWPEEAIETFDSWLGNLYIDHMLKAGGPAPKITFSGKNFGKFDFQFLRRMPGWGNIKRISHRFVDPTFAFWNPIEDFEPPANYAGDEELPSTEELP